MKKNSTQRKNCTSNPYLPDPGVSHGTGSAGATTDQELAHLVWKYFQSEITEAGAEVQETLAPEKSHSSPAKSRKA